MELLLSAAMTAYEQVVPRVHAAWTAFWSPGVHVLPGTSVGLVRVLHHGRTYGVYVPLDTPSFSSGTGASVVLKASDGTEAWLDPPPLPGLRLRLPPRALGAVGALRLDPLDDDAEEYDEGTLLP